MTRARAFNFDVPSEDDQSPFPLTINGDDVMCRGVVDGYILLEYTAGMSRTATMGERARALDAFLRECMEPTEYEKFRKICSKNLLDIDPIVDIAQYLTEVYSERPTSSAGSSPTGQTTTGSSSEETSSAGV